MERITILRIFNEFDRDSKILYGNDLNIKFNFLKRMDIEVDYAYLKEKIASESGFFSLYSALINYQHYKLSF